MLESAQNLLIVSKDEAKIQKLQEAVKAHQSNLDRIREQLGEAKSKDSQAYTNQFKLATPLSTGKKPKYCHGFILLAWVEATGVNKWNVYWTC